MNIIDCRNADTLLRLQISGLVIVLKLLYKTDPILLFYQRQGGYLLMEHSKFQCFHYMSIKICEMFSAQSMHWVQRKCTATETLVLLCFFEAWRNNWFAHSHLSLEDVDFYEETSYTTLKLKCWDYWPIFFVGDQISPSSSLFSTFCIFVVYVRSGLHSLFVCIEG